MSDIVSTGNRPATEFHARTPDPLPCGKLFALAVAVLIAVASGFRWWHLGNIPGINGDEAREGYIIEMLFRGRPLPWFTPSHNPIDPFYLLPLLLLHKFAGPSFALLRATAALSGMAALLLNFVLCRRVFNVATATISTLLLAVLPIDIVYSRLGWYPAQTLFACLLVTYALLRVDRDKRTSQKWVLVAVIGFVCALVIHPTNLFIGPLFLVVLWQWRPSRRSSASANEPPAKAGRLIAGFVAIVFVAMTACDMLSAARDAPGPTIPASVMAGALARHPQPPSITQYASLNEALITRLIHPLQFIRFLRDAGRLFSGITVYRYAAGSCYSAPLQVGKFAVDVTFVDVIGAVLWSFALFGAYRESLESGVAAVRTRCLLWSTIYAMLAFYLVAGPDFLQPHFERYGLWLVGPATVLFTIGLVHWAKRPVWRRPLKAGVLLASGLLLLGFYVNFFQFIERTGGLSHDTFRTAAIEPKEGALQYILGESPAGQPVTIVSSEYWNRLPLQYLAARDANIEVLTPDDAMHIGFLNKIFKGQVWYVEYADSDEARKVRDDMDIIHQKYTREVIRDYGGYDLLVVIHPLA